MVGYSSVEKRGAWYFKALAGYVEAAVRPLT